MEVLDTVWELIGFDEEAQIYLITFGLRLAIFIVLVLLSLLIGRYTPSIVALVIRRFFPQKVPLSIKI